MRRADFVQLIGLSDPAFNLLRARKLLPLRGQPESKGWQEYSVDDALALEIAQALARKGVRKADARDWVNLYFDVALEYAADPGRPKGQSVYLGAAEIVGQVEGVVHHEDDHELVGTSVEIAEELERLAEALGPHHAVDGYLVVNVHRCLRALLQRAESAGIQEPRLQELAGWFR